MRDWLNLMFRKEKLAVMIFSDNEGSEHKIQEVVLEIVNQCKHLGVWIKHSRAEYLRSTKDT